MTLMTQARNAYAIANTPTKSDRTLEYEVIAQVTSKLTTAAKEGTNFPDLVTAVEANRRLWTTIASSVADIDNSLSSELKAQMFFLFEFTIEHSRKVIKREIDVSPLIDINLAVMRGLKSVQN